MEPLEERRKKMMEDLGTEEELGSQNRQEQDDLTVKIGDHRRGEVRSREAATRLHILLTGFRQQQRPNLLSLRLTLSLALSLTL